MAQRRVTSSTTVSSRAPSGTVTTAAAQSSATRGRSARRSAGGTNGTTSASSSSSATGTATPGPYSADSEGDRISAEPKPEKPRTVPASSAAPTATANAADVTSRLAPPASITRRDATGRSGGQAVAVGDRGGLGPAAD